MNQMQRRALLRLTPSFFAVGLTNLFLSGCSNEVHVSPEQQAAGRKSKTEALKGLTSTKSGETTGKSRPKRKGPTAVQDQDPF